MFEWQKKIKPIGKNPIKECSEISHITWSEMIVLVAAGVCFFQARIFLWSWKVIKRISSFWINFLYNMWYLMCESTCVLPVMKNGQTYFKNLASFTSQDFSSIMHETVNKNIASLTFLLCITQLLLVKVGIPKLWTFVSPEHRKTNKNHDKQFATQRSFKWKKIVDIHTWIIFFHKIFKIFFLKVMVSRSSVIYKFEYSKPAVRRLKDGCS